MSDRSASQREIIQKLLAGLGEESTDSSLWQQFKKAFDAKDIERANEIGSKLLLEDMNMSLWTRISLIAAQATRAYYAGDIEAAKTKFEAGRRLVGEALKYPAEGVRGDALGAFFSRYGELAVWQDDQKLAYELLTSAVKYAPDDADGHYHLGLVWIRRHEREKALASLTKAVELEPKHTFAWIYRGIVENTLHRFVDSTKSWLKAYELDNRQPAPDGQSLLGLVADAYTLAGDKEAANSHYERAVGVVPHELTYQHWVVALADWNPLQMVRVAEEAIAKRKDTPYVRFHLGAFYRITDDERGTRLLRDLVESAQTPAELRREVRALLRDDFSARLRR